jgi:hypothetical protein
MDLFDMLQNPEAVKELEKQLGPVLEVTKKYAVFGGSELLKTFSEILESEGSRRLMDKLAISRAHQLQAYMAQGFTREEALSFMMADKAAMMELAKLSQAVQVKKS